MILRGGGADTMTQAKFIFRDNIEAKLASEDSRSRSAKRTAFTMEDMVSIIRVKTIKEIAQFTT